MDCFINNGIYTNLIDKLYDTNYTFLCINDWHTKHSLRLLQFVINWNIGMLSGPFCYVNYVEQLAR